MAAPRVRAAMTLRLGSFIPHQLACVFTYAAAASIRCVSVVLIVFTLEAAVNGDGAWRDRTYLDMSTNRDL